MKLHGDVNIVLSNATSRVAEIRPLAQPFPFFAVITASRVAGALSDCHLKPATRASDVVGSHGIGSWDGLNQLAALTLASTKSGGPLQGNVGECDCNMRSRSELTIG